MACSTVAPRGKHLMVNTLRRSSLALFNDGLPKKVAAEKREKRERRERRESAS